MSKRQSLKAGLKIESIEDEDRSTSPKRKRINVRKQVLLEEEAGISKSESKALSVKSKSKRSAASKQDANKTPADDTLPPLEESDSEDEFRDKITNIYLRNKLSAKESADLIRSAHKSGARDLADCSKIGKKQPKNANRDLMRKCIKKATLPKPYYASIPVKDRKTGAPRRATLPFLLVHEVLFQICVAMGMAFRDCTEFPEGSGFAKVKAKFARDHGIHEDGLLVPIGIHGDGVPFQKKSSLELISWNLCCIEGSERNLFGSIEKQDLCDCGCYGRHTLDAMLEIFVWSTQALLTGKFPNKRHDSIEWGRKDGDRAARSGEDLHFKGYLAQCRGDWQWFKWLFGFKGWAGQNVCWRCGANKTDCPYWDASPGAAWRVLRYGTGMFLDMVRQNGVAISPLFSCPGFDMLNICIDVLHALDLGLAQEIVGNVLFEALGVFAAGRNRKEQVQDLQSKMKDHYKRMGTKNRINQLTAEMIKRDGKAPKLRSKGAESRHIVPFALEIATAMHANGPNDHTLTVLRLVSALMDFYMTLGVRPYPVELAKKACRAVCLLYVALNEEAVAAGKDAWRVKPKLHIFQEMGEYQTEQLGDPKSYWCYTDEDFVGLCSEIGFSRGGPSTAETTPGRVCDRFRALSAHP